MRLTIIPSDRTVIVDGVAIDNLDLSSCEMPSNVHALQWFTDHGELEWKGHQNEPLAELPSWAVACKAVWQTAYELHMNPPPPTTEQLVANARAWRDDLLTECDWTQLPDVQLSDEQKQAWLTYRQALRDVTLQAGFPENIQWPNPPSNG